MSVNDINEREAKHFFSCGCPTLAFEEEEEEFDEEEEEDFDEDSIRAREGLMSGTALLAADQTQSTDIAGGCIMVLPKM